MGHSQADKAQSRERIVAAAARRVREQGLDGLGIAELMKECGLTHGGFYGHFASREALLVVAVVRALEEGEQASLGRAAPDTLRGAVHSYLSRAHRDDPGGGCAIAALAPELGRPEHATLRPGVTRRVEVTLERLETLLGNAPRAGETAMALWSLMVGALALARMTADPARSDSILRAARQAALALAAGPADSVPP